ncbi:hypothetical protein FQR65_LT01358 [Abscondita terminalis]|nr:hypothetical protein FQR65_LT01358 [Abscondita terminalis]
MLSLHWHYYLFSFALFIFIRFLLSFVRTKSKPSFEEAVISGGEGEDDELNNWHLGLNCEHVPLQFEKCSKNESVKRSHDYYELMNKRRTVRHFSTETFPIEVLYNVIKTAGNCFSIFLSVLKRVLKGTSPSGAHTEPWKFAIVKSQAIKENIRQIVEEQEEVNYKKRMGKQWVNDLKFLRTFWVKEYITDAPYLILVFKKMYSIDNNGRKQLHYYSEQSVNIAAGMVLAAIQNAGLVSLTSTPLNCGPALKTLLNRPSEEKLAFLLPVGYPSEDCTVPNLKRKSLDELMTLY